MLPCESMTWICRWLRPSSASIRVLTVFPEEKPWLRQSRPLGPKCGLTSAWVASAPTPLFAWAQSMPTAKKRLATATPNSPAGPRATIDQVMLVGGNARVAHHAAPALEVALDQPGELGRRAGARRKSLLEQAGARVRVAQYRDELRIEHRHHLAWQAGRAEQRVP